MNEVFVKLVNMSVAAGWLILAVLVLRLALKKAPRWITCLLWALVAVRLVCPISLQSPVSAYQVASPAAVQPTGQVEYFQYVHAGGDKPSIQLDVDAIRPAETAPAAADSISDGESPARDTVTRYPRPMWPSGWRWAVGYCCTASPAPSGCGSVCGRPCACGTISGYATR